MEAVTEIHRRLTTPSVVKSAMEQQQAGTWDSVEACLECITTCSVDDGECVTTCVRTHLGDEEELWTSSLCL